MSAAGPRAESYRDHYRRVFANLAHALTPGDGMSAASISRAEKKLGIRLPDALRHYYLMSGHEPVLNQIHNRLLAPDEWELHSGKLVFMEENQTVVVWGVTASPEPDDDAKVFQAPVVDGEPGKWHREHDHCSGFLVTILHWQAISGGMSSIASATVPETMRTQLDSDWEFAGELNQMRAYNRNGRAVCFLEWFGPWKIFAGAINKGELDAIGKELGLQWD